MSQAYLTADEAPTREAVDRMPGRVLIEFGTPWCVFCKHLAPEVAALVAEHPEVRHVRVEDGPGQPLGRSFQIRLWPNLVFLKDGAVVQQLARPSADELRAAFAAFTAAA